MAPLSFPSLLTMKVLPLPLFLQRPVFCVSGSLPMTVFLLFHQHYNRITGCTLRIVNKDGNYGASQWNTLNSSKYPVPFVNGNELVISATVVPDVLIQPTRLRSTTYTTKQIEKGLSTSMFTLLSSHFSLPLCKCCGCRHILHVSLFGLRAQCAIRS